jgi:prepilin-type N-terminal cleavage/methylation domain-containing protein
MSPSRPSNARAFTLVEMLVVIGIIGVLIALLLPAINAARRNALNASIAFEIKTIDQSLETYKQQRGEYPPCFGDYNASGTLVYGTAARNNSAVERHLQRCYPKFTNTTNKDAFYQKLMDTPVDQAEALVMWLSMISTEPGNPFDATATASRHGYQEFDSRRLVDNDGDGISTFQAKYCRETDYIYIENRNYMQHMQRNCFARSGDGNSLQRAIPFYTRDPMNNLVPVNPKRFQIICSGQDGEFYRSPPDTAANVPAVGISGSNYTPKEFPSGTNYLTSGADRDNLTNFSEGRTLGDSRPQ